MKYLHLANFIFFLLMALMNPYVVSAQSVSDADKILGVWNNQEKTGKIEVYKSGNKYFGKIIGGAPGASPRKDIKNPNPALQSRNLVGVIILNNFIFKKGLWSDGTIYDPDSGKTYSCNIKYKNGELEIRGFVGISLFGRTSIWTKV